MNRHISTVIIAPLTSTTRNYPTRIDCQFAGKKGQIVLDQIRYGFQILRRMISGSSFNSARNIHFLSRRVRLDTVSRLRRGR
ncbi:MAG: hypothetical protein KDH97_11180 [Calditrichaeota bacterium]|nr:hypothetical protein [Calditrichota bacterium]MCB0290807.1 hypothetical protein [Calditrichota bacterium]MCB0294439.1 hypothetical protein [Calditrichota bacterium]